MHQISVMYLPAEVIEVIEVGSYWSRIDCPEMLLVYKADPGDDVYLIDIATGNRVVLQPATLRKLASRLRNVKIEIEVR